MANPSTPLQTRGAPQDHDVRGWVLQKLTDSQAKFHFHQKRYILPFSMRLASRKNDESLKELIFLAGIRIIFCLTSLLVIQVISDPVQMPVVLTCSHSQEPQPLIGIDATCHLPAIFCLGHSPYTNKDGLLHQTMSLGQFKHTLNEQKFKMIDKVAVLTGQYSAFTGNLIKEITELKLRKVLELSMLWLRELAMTEEEYKSLRRINHNKQSGSHLQRGHNLYFKLVGNEVISNKKVEEIGCYRDICGVIAKFQSSLMARTVIMKKVGELKEIVQHRELLMKALPDRRALKENTKEILLEQKIITIKEIVAVFNQFFRVFLIKHTSYHLLITAKCINILLSLCGEFLQRSTGITYLHYNPHSIVFNCSKGCLYRDDMLQSGSSHLRKGQNVLELILRITDRSKLILLGKNVACPTGIEKFKKGKLFLHHLMRKDCDGKKIDRDKVTMISKGKQEQKQMIYSASICKKNSEAIIEDQPSFALGTIAFLFF